MTPDATGATSDGCQCFPNGTPFVHPSPSQHDANDKSKSSSASNNDTNPWYLSVASFNLLAPVYVRPFDKRTGGVQPFAAFEWISDEDSAEILDIHNHRGPRLLKSLQTCNADVLCLQELQMEKRTSKSEDDDTDSYFQLPSWLLPITELYDVHLPPVSEMEIIAQRNLRVLDQEATVICAIFTKKNIAAGCCKVLQERERDNNTCVSILLSKTPSSEDALSLPSSVVITSVHLDATDETKRTSQLTRCIRRARELQNNNNSTNDKLQKRGGELISTIIAGDMNTELFPGSCTRAFLVTTEADRNGDTSTAQTPLLSDMERECASALRLGKDQKPTDKQVEEWQELYSDVQKTVEEYCVSLNRVETGATRSAYDHNQEEQTTSTIVSSDNNTKIPQQLLQSQRRRMGQWRLDHILYTTTTLRPLAHWSTLEADPESCQIGLPNRRWGSDHLPVGALFEVTPTPRLSAEEESALSYRLQALLERQRTELTTRQEELDAELAALEAKIAQAQPATNASAGDTKQDESSSTPQQPKKKKKKQKGPPPKEIMDFMRTKRSILKQLKEQYKKERSDMTQDFGDLQRLFIEQEYGCTASQWVERGKY